MPSELDHTVVYAEDKSISANFLSHILGTKAPRATPPFMAVALDNGVTLDFGDAPAPIAAQHYAFLVDDATFDAAFARVRDKRLNYWADPMLGRAQARSTAATEDAAFTSRTPPATSSNCSPARTAVRRKAHPFS